MRRKFLLFAPLAFVAFLLFIALGGAVVQYLWNWLTPALFGLKQISFWQALGLLALSRILFGGFGRHGWHHGGFRRRMRERWDDMKPEERERLRQGMRDRWGFGAPRGADPGTSSGPVSA